jgi:hypothetical protein
MVYKDGLKTIRLWRSRCPGTLREGMRKKEYLEIVTLGYNDFNNLMAQTRKKKI